MAFFNEILVGRFNRFLQRFLSMKGGPPARQLASEVMPTIRLDAAEHLENRFPMGWREYGTLAGATALAGNRAAIKLLNPAGSGIIAVIEKITVFGNATDFPVLSRGVPSGTGFTAGVAEGSRDSRQSGVSTCLLQTSVNAGAVAGFQLWQGAYLANVQVDVIQDDNQELVIMPGDFYTVWATNLATLLNVSFFWRERALEEGELT